MKIQNYLSGFCVILGIQGLGQIIIIFLIIWVIPSILLGLAGRSRKIGFWGAFLLSLIFSPVIGLIGVILSQRK